MAPPNEETAALPPDVFVGDRYTASQWLDLLRDQFHTETWRAAVAVEAVRCRVTELVLQDSKQHG